MADPRIQVPGKKDVRKKQAVNEGLGKGPCCKKLSSEMESRGSLVNLGSFRRIMSTRMIGKSAFSVTW